MQTKRKGLSAVTEKANNQNICKNIYKSIISQKMERSERKMIKEVEEILGYQVDKEKYEDAYEYAKHKLDWQSKRYGATYSTEYLEIVIAEIYEQQQFTEYMHSLARRVQA